jgi:RNA polymerase sigma-70 factor (ECF subfamily)
VAARRNRQKNCKETLRDSTNSHVGESELNVSANPEQEEYWRQTAREYGAALERLAWAYEPDPDRRRDLLQELHLALWRSFESFDGRCSLRTWIYRVAHNVAISRVARRRRMEPVFVTLEDIAAQPSTQNVEKTADRQMALARLLSLVHQLELIDRQLMLAYLEDLDAETMSQITGLSVANVWTRIHRIKQILSRQFHAGGPNAR